MKFRLMTSNIWGDFFGNPVEPRSPLLAAVFAKYSPDILGLQEVGPSWWASSLIPEIRKNYEQIPIETNGKLNCNPIFYRPEKFELLYSNWHLFHEDLDYSKGWNCGVFRDKAEHKVFAVFCTHFWWKSELADAVIRRYNAMEMCLEMKRIGDFFDCPVFFMGDLNSEIGTPAWQYLEAQGWRSSFYCTGDHTEYSSNHHDPIIHADGTCTGAATDEPKENSIDHIGIPAGVKVLRQFAVIDREALDASDHSPVYADIEL